MARYVLFQISNRLGDSKKLQSSEHMGFIKVTFAIKKVLKTPIVNFRYTVEMKIFIPVVSQVSCL